MRLPKLAFSFLLIGVLLSTFTFTQAQTSDFTLLQTINPPQPISDESFGAGVAVDGDTAVVRSSDGAFVYVKQVDTWVFQALLQPSIAKPTDIYQYDVAISGDTVLIGAQTDAGDTGAVYVFTRSGTSWSQQAKLTASDAAPSQQYGFSLALQGDTALIGARGANAAYIFTRSFNVWTQAQKLTSSTPTSRFGWSVALYNDAAVVGAPGDSTMAEQAGAAFIFTRNSTGWAEQAKLVQPEAEEYDSFGSDVDIEGDTVVVANSVEGSGDPGVYTFTRTGTAWAFQQQLVPASSGAALSVSLEGQLLAVGSPWGGIPFTNDEAVTIFANNSGIWTQQQVITPPLTSKDFGWDVSLDNGTLFVGGPNYFNQDPSFDSAVFVYTNVTVSPPANLLINGDFEIDADQNYVPDDWSRKNTVDDALRCNKAGKPPVAYSGNCAYLLKGATASNRKLAQNIDVTHLNAGDNLKLTGFYNKQSTGDVFVYIFVSYSNLPQDQARIKVTAPTSGYQPIPAVAVTLKAKPTRVRIEIQNRTTSGKTYFDMMSMVKQGSTTLIPLP